MGKRTNAKARPAGRASAPPASQTSQSDMEGRLVAYAEHLGWMVGTVQAKTEGWLEQETLSANLTRIRDGAMALLAELNPAADKPAPGARQKRTRPRSGGVVDAPGKRHRVPPPSVRGAKHSDERIPKLKTAKVRGRRGGR